MIYFFVVIVLLYYVSLHDIRGQERGYERHQKIVLLIFTLLAGLRFRMAPDSITFEYEFLNIYPKIYDIRMSDFTTSRYPPIWFLSNCLFNTFANYYIFQLFCAFISNYLISKFVSSVSTKYFTVMLFYYIFNYCYFNMDVMREFMAISFEMFALSSLFKRNIKTATLFAILAPLIHSFSIFFSLLICLLYIRPTKKLLITIGICGVLIVLNFDNIIPIIITYVPGLSVSILFYALMDVENISLLGFISKLISPILLFFILRVTDRNNLLIFNKTDSVVLKNNNSAYLLVISYLIIVFLRWSIPYADRLFNYFAIIGYVIYAYGFYRILAKNSTHNMQLMKLVLICVLFYLPTAKEMFTLNEANVPIYYRYYPYSSIFDKKICYEREEIIYSEQRVYD